MKSSQLHEMSVEVLKKELLALLREQFNLRIKKSTGQLTTTHNFRLVRRNIARIHTKLAEKAGISHE